MKPEPERTCEVSSTDAVVGKASVTMDLYHYYHIYADGDWERIVAEHFDDLRVSGLAGQLVSVNVGIVGTWLNRFLVTEWIDRYLIANPFPPLYIIAQATIGWEQVTINAMRRDAEIRGNGLALYAHTKGAAFPGDHPDRWRDVMARECVYKWSDVVDQMEVFGYDTAGAYFIEEDLYEEGVPIFAGVHGVSTLMRSMPEGSVVIAEGPDEPKPVLKRVHYSGNYWWSTLAWLRRLSNPCPTNTRWDGEMFVGRAANGDLPMALNLRAGSPFVELRT